MSNAFRPLTHLRIRAIRDHAALRQEDLALLLGVGLASINRWEREASSLPTGLPRQVLLAMGRLMDAGVNLAPVREMVARRGSTEAVRWILNLDAEGGVRV